ncbi:hypothetical protein, partial [Amycolatopsis jejuensis]|uniref:hypothetical protein n=1 Tax=Amycolatopsis jejuensis TaxID=330084 RepID=UPI001B80B8C6
MHQLPQQISHRKPDMMRPQRHRHHRPGIPPLAVSSTNPAAINASTRNDTVDGASTVYREISRRVRATPRR